MAIGRIKKEDKGEEKDGTRRYNEGGGGTSKVKESGRGTRFNNEQNSGKGERLDN